MALFSRGHHHFARFQVQEIRSFHQGIVTLKSGFEIDPVNLSLRLG
jgi:hypothetical protein